MGSRGQVGLFIILFVQLFANHAAPYPQRALPKDYFPEYVSKNESGIKEDRRIDHRFGLGSNNSGKGENDGSGSRSQHVQGKANFIPIYAAGAARQGHRKGHRSPASCLRNSAVLSYAVGAATSAASLFHTYMIF